MNVVLAAGDHFAFSSSTWSNWADSPHDLQLVTKMVFLELTVASSSPSLNTSVVLSKHLDAVVALLS